MSSGARKIEIKSFHAVAGVFLIVLLVIRPLYLAYGEHRVLQEQKVVNRENKFARSSRLRNDNIVHGDESIAKCNLFQGRWMYDEKSSPLYKEKECSFMTTDFACEKYGRKDFKYQNWRWQPRHCDLPRFNGAAFLKKIRGKKLIFVGDSLNRNQWVSMLCLIDSSLPPPSSKSVIRTGNLFTFEAKEYNASIGFYWSPFLVETNSDDPIVHRPSELVIGIKAIEKHAKYWTDADILIFDSYLWWLEPTKTLLWGSFGSSNAIYKRVGMRERIYEMGLNTWSEWLEININRTKTELFFMSIAPSHEWVEGWNYREESCYATTEPISDERYWGVTANRSMMEVAESAMRNLEARGLKIKYLNITQMTGYRKDAHPSIHRQFYHNITEEQLMDPRSYSDCVHWCLPGVPDTWNQILYAYLINTTSVESV